MYARRGYFPEIAKFVTRMWFRKAKCNESTGASRGNQVLTNYRRFRSGIFGKFLLAIGNDRDVEREIPLILPENRSPLKADLSTIRRVQSRSRKEGEIR